MLPYYTTLLHFLIWGPQAKVAVCCSVFQFAYLTNVRLRCAPVRAGSCALQRSAAVRPDPCLLQPCEKTQLCVCCACTNIPSIEDPQHVQDPTNAVAPVFDHHDCHFLHRAGRRGRLRIMFSSHQTCLWLILTRSISTVGSVTLTENYGRYRRSVRLHLRRITPVAGLIFETKNRAIFLERIFGRGITAREQLSRAVILARF